YNFFDFVSRSSYFVALHLDFCFYFTVRSVAPVYALSLHDALPISFLPMDERMARFSQFKIHSFAETAKCRRVHEPAATGFGETGDRKSTRLNSSHLVISYAVFCLKKKKEPITWAEVDAMTEKILTH